MERLEEIQEEFAIKIGFKSFNDMYLTCNFRSTKTYIRSIAEQYAKECSLASLEKASENAKVEKEYSIKYQDFIPDGIDKDSIIDENNIVLL